jgi:hypothetical protein
MTFHDFPYEDSLPAARGTRHGVATVLRAASRWLDALAQRLALVEAPASTERVLEFHSEAGAPEGALYVNGQLVGHLLGVTRL